MKQLFLLVIFALSTYFINAQELEYNRIIGSTSQLIPWEMMQLDSAHTLIHGVSDNGDFLMKVDGEYNVIWDRIIEDSNQTLWNLQSKNITSASDSSFYYVTGFEQAPPINGIAIHEMSFDGDIIKSESFLFDQEVHVKYVHTNGAGKIAFTMNYDNTVLYCQKNSDNNLTFTQLSMDGNPIEINTIKTISDSLTILLGGDQLEQNGGFPIAIAINKDGLIEWSKKYEIKDNNSLWKAFDIFQGDSTDYILLKEVYEYIYHSEFDINTGEISSSVNTNIQESEIYGPIASKYIASNYDGIYLKSGLSLLQISPENQIVSISNEIGLFAVEMIDSVSFHYAGALGLLPAKNRSFYPEFGIKNTENLFFLFNLNFDGNCEWLEVKDESNSNILTSDIEININYGTLVPEDVTFLFEEYNLSMEDGCVRIPDNVQTSNIDYSIDISPNPSSGEFFIELDNETMNQISVYNELGSLIKNIHFQKGITNTTLDLSRFSSGIYFIRMDLEYSSTMKKVVVQN